MRNPFFFGVGGVVSADIAVPEHDQEVDFYSKILTTGETPLWRPDLNNNLGTPVIGLGARTPEYEFLPLQWMPHFQVEDVATSVAHALEMGGKELVHSKSDDGQSQWAGIADPTGAGFGVIPVVSAEPDYTQHKERVGCISWLSLTVSDTSPVREFYQRVIGWDSKHIEPDMTEQTERFEMNASNETAVADIIQRDDDRIPSVWLIHLPVDDLSESLRRVTDGGGQVVEECGQREYAVVRDPVGVYFALRPAE